MKRIPDEKKRTVSARFPKPLVTKLKILAYKQNRSVSAMLQTLVEKAIEEEAANV